MRRLAELRQDTLWDMPTDDFNAMVPADPAPTTEKKGKKKLVWSTRTQIMAIGTAIASTTYVLPTDAPLLALQQGVANVMYDHYYQDPSTLAWVPVQPLYTPLCLEEGMKLQDIVALAMCNFETAGKYKD